MQTLATKRTKGTDNNTIIDALARLSLKKGFLWALHRKKANALADRDEDRSRTGSDDVQLLVVGGKPKQLTCVELIGQSHGGGCAGMIR